jgi:hypothetical protein
MRSKSASRRLTPSASNSAIPLPEGQTAQVGGGHLEVNTLQDRHTMGLARIVPDSRISNSILAATRVQILKSTRGKG